MLADGRKCLVGDRFSTADIAFAADAALMVPAAGYTDNLPDFEELPRASQAIFEEFRARPAGRFCQLMYDLHRRKSQN